MRQERYARNLKVTKKNLLRDFTRLRDKVSEEFKKRYELMLRSVGMSWKPVEPLPKPQVLYEDDD